MALPSHLAKYDGLIDLVVEQIVREIEKAAKNTQPVPERNARPKTVRKQSPRATPEQAPMGDSVVSLTKMPA
jgi:hypothetical protein